MFDTEAINRCHQVLCDVLATLEEVRTEAYLIGGWAIYYILQRTDPSLTRLQYAGTLDVDVALVLQLPEREELVKQLMSKGYVRHDRIENRLLRPFPEGEIEPVAVDLLGGTREVLRTFTHHIEIVGKTPYDTPFQGSVAVTNMEACLAMKAIAFDRNPKQKDAYDIYYLITYAKDHEGDCADHVIAKLDYPFIRDGLKALEVHFGRREGKGLRRAMQMLRDQDGLDSVMAPAAVRGSFRAFFHRFGRTVDY